MGAFTPDTYATAEAGHEAVLDDRTVRAFDDIYDAEMWEGERITNIVLQAYEKEVADYLFNATTFAGKTAAVGTAWSTLATCTPVTDVNTRRETIAAAYGTEPNALIINRTVFRNLINCAQIVDRLKSQGFQDARPGQINEAALAISLDLDYVIVAGAMQNTANAAKTRSLSRQWSSSFALLAKVATSNNPTEPCLGRTIVWDEESAQDGDRLAVIMEKYRDESVRSDVIRARTDWGRKIVHLDAGYLLSGV
jgi:hypothetical protein